MSREIKKPLHSNGLYHAYIRKQVKREHFKNNYKKLTVQKRCSQTHIPKLFFSCSNNSLYITDQCFLKLISLYGDMFLKIRNCTYCYTTKSAPIQSLWTSFFFKLHSRGAEQPCGVNIKPQQELCNL